MVSKRRPIHTAPTAGQNMNFRGSAATDGRGETKGTRPTTSPTSIREVLTMMVLYVCKKAIFYDINLKVALYLGSLFLISLIGDFMPYPRTYFARSDNLFNQYFVKIGWFWTLILTIPYSVLTSYILCCGDAKRTLKHHMVRIAIATMFWYSWTKLFNVIEAAYGRCTDKRFDTKSSCLKAGSMWHGFDLSGHAYILIYSSLVLIEEARSIVNWESIKEHLRNEEHNRSTGDTAAARTPLSNLKDDDLARLSHLYTRYTPLIRLLFVAMTVLQVLWDVMLVSTMLYFHKMIEKVISGIIAILTWFFTYRFWYVSATLPDAVGKGLFVYQREKARPEPMPMRRNPSIVINPATGKPTPRFMGMPLYTGRQDAGVSNGVNPEPGPSRI
uniref:Putative inositol phospholipid synthesis protein scs3p n=1 Tax=Phlebotomus kandelakii TaxID=1109342 RepID=A0A6B2EC49_9DIPT